MRPMIPRILVTLVALAGTAAAAYPTVAPHPSAAVRAAREAEFRKRNPQAWSVVEVNPRGFVSRVVTSDPGLVPTLGPGAAWPDASVATVRAFLRANADLFGFDPATADRLPGGGPSLLLMDVVGGAAMLGEINVQYASRPAPSIEITVMFWVEGTPKLSAADVAKRLIGTRYAETIGYAAPSHLDCAMGPAGVAGCDTPIERTRQRDVSLGAGDVEGTMALLPDGDKIRLVACVDASRLADPPPDRSWGNLEQRKRTLVPRGSAPHLPLVVDAVTGETLATGAKSCLDPIFNVRDER